jgi:O-antigen/teichoic acid export membrane protein
LRILLLSLALIILFLAQPYLVDITSAGLFLPLILALITGSVYGGMYSGIYGQGKLGIAKTGELLSFFGRIIIQVAAVFLGYELAGLLGGFIIGMITGGLLFLRFTDLSLVIFSRTHVRSLLAFSLWIFLTAGGNLVFSISDVVIIGYFLTNTDVGIYRVALQLSTAATFTTIALQSALYPQISSWSVQGDLERIRISLCHAFTYSLFLAVPVAVGGWILGDRLLFYLFGEAFQPGSGSLYVLLGMQVVNVFMYLQVMSLNALDRPRDSFHSTTIAAGLNIALNIGLIPIFGILGAAFATAISMGVNALLSYLLLRRIVPVQVDPASIRNILAATLIMGGAVLLLRIFLPPLNAMVLLGTVAVGGGIYLTSLFSLDRKMYREIRDLVRSFGGPWPHWIDRYFT